MTTQIPSPAPRGAAVQRSHPHPHRLVAPGHRGVMVATFNLHVGVDGWGRAYDPVAACEKLDADVLVLQETWTPKGQKGLAHLIADALGYQVTEQIMAQGRRSLPLVSAGRGWGPTIATKGQRATLFLDSERPLPSVTLRSSRYQQAGAGSVGVAVLSRLEVVAECRLDLGRLRSDGAHRFGVGVTLDAGGRPLSVVGTHMSHLTMGSPRQLRRLWRAVEEWAPKGPRVLAGDMNLWGPPLSALLPGWRRAVKGPTWPAWRPHSQLDHILVSSDARVSCAAVAPPAGSDHRPVWVELDVGGDDA